MQFLKNILFNFHAVLQYFKCDAYMYCFAYISNFFYPIIFILLIIPFIIESMYQMLFNGFPFLSNKKCDKPCVKLGYISIFILQGPILF